MTRIGFLGPGQLGGPMVGRLHAAGHQLVVHARRPEVRADLALLGVRAVARPEELTGEAELVLACVFSDAQLEQVALPVLAALRPGAVFASHVTGSHRTLLRLAELGRARGVHVLDAPVSGTAADIAAGRLTVLLGGDDPDALALAEQVLGAYADPVVRTGAAGSALTVKLVNNVLFAAQAQLVAAAAALGEQLGVPSAGLLASLQHCSAQSRVAAHAAAAPSMGDFGSAVAPYLAKDVAACRSLLRDLGVSAELLMDVVERGPLPLDA